MRHRSGVGPAVVVLATCFACAGATLVSPEHLAKPAAPIALRLRGDAVWSIPGGNRGLSAGHYVAEHEDAEGVYYRGPAGCVFSYGESNPKETALCRWDGGVWIPKTPGSSAKLYIYKGTAKFGPAGSQAPTITPDAFGRVGADPAQPPPPGYLVTAAALSLERGKIQLLQIPDGVEIVRLLLPGDAGPAAATP